MTTAPYASAAPAGASAAPLHAGRARPRRALFWTIVLATAASLGLWAGLIYAAAAVWRAFTG